MSKIVATELTCLNKEASATLSSQEEGQDNVLSPKEWSLVDEVAKKGFTINDQIDMKRMGKKQEFRRNFRFLTTVGMYNPKPFVWRNSSGPGFTCCVMVSQPADSELNLRR